MGLRLLTHMLHLDLKRRMKHTLRVDLVPVGFVLSCANISPCDLDRLCGRHCHLLGAALRDAAPALAARVHNRDRREATDIVRHMRSHSIADLCNVVARLPVALPSSIIVAALMRPTRSSGLSSMSRVGVGRRRRRFDLCQHEMSAPLEPAPSIHRMSKSAGPSAIEVTSSSLPKCASPGPPSLQYEAVATILMKLMAEPRAAPQEGCASAGAEGIVVHERGRVLPLVSTTQTLGPSWGTLGGQRWGSSLDVGWVWDASPRADGAILPRRAGLHCQSSHCARLQVRIWGCPSFLYHEAVKRCRQERLSRGVVKRGQGRRRLDHPDSNGPHPVAKR